jgi:porin
MRANRARRRAARIALAVAASAAAHADAPPDQTLTGDWGGVRSALADRGIAPFLTYIPGAWANVHGGIETGVRYEALADFGVNFDLGRLFDWPGARFHIDWHWNQGDLPSQHLIGQFTTDAVAGYEAVNSLRFYEIYFEQRLPGDAGRVKAGQITMDEDFFVSQYAGSLLNASFALFGSGRDEQLAPFYPVAAPGLYIEVRPAGDWTVRGGMYTVDVGDDVGSNHGFEWSMNQGSTGALEIATRRSPAGLPGTYTFGIVATSKTVIDFATGGTAHGSTGLYLMTDQALVVGSDGQPKVGGFLRIGYDPLATRALLHYYGNAGFSVSAPFSGRPEDSFSAGISHAAFAPDYIAAERAAGEAVTNHESIVELDYAAVVNGWLTLQPDFQLVLNPYSSDRTAWVLGLQATIKL